MRKTGTKPAKVRAVVPASQPDSTPPKPERSGRTFSEVSPDKIPKWAQTVLRALNEGAKRNVETP